YGLLIIGLLGLALLSFDLPGLVQLRGILLTAGHADNVSFHYIGLVALLATFVITGAAVIPPNAVFCNPIIRMTGVCGYSFYTSQILVMQVLGSFFGVLGPLPQFIVAAIATFFVSIFSFAIIELPAMTWGHALARRLVEGRADRRLKEAA